jgi:hypothetical protein
MSLTDEQRAEIDKEVERLREMLKSSPVGQQDMKAYTETYKLKTCKMCGNVIDDSFKSRLCTPCYFKLKNSRKRRYY